MIRVRFMSLSGKFEMVRETDFATVDLAFEAAQAHGRLSGYSHFAKVDDEDGMSLRVTARTPGGRGGRNIAYIEYGYLTE